MPGVVISNVISSERMRYLLDTCVIVSAMRSANGSSNQVLHLVLTGRIPAVCHYKLMAEYREVLERMIESGDLAYSRWQVERFLAALAAACEAVEVRYLLRPNLRDEGDNFVYELAFAASPVTIVTHNLRDFPRSEIGWPGILIKTPRHLLEEVETNA